MACVLWLLVSVGLLILGADSQQSCSSDNAVRLVWGEGPWEGNVQICKNGVWGWVCDNNFFGADAKVVCNQLGYSTNGAVYRMWSYYGWGNVTTPIHLDGIDCAGTENRLIDCSRPYPVGVTSCGYNEIAGVVCPAGGPSCTNGGIRRIRNNNGVPFRGNGRVEVCYSNQWGTVCDDAWGNNDAKVACFQLGYTKSRVSRYCCAAFGQGYGPIFLDNVGCSGSQNTLQSCNHNGVGNHNCGHNEDAGIGCYGSITSSCTNGDVMLWRPNNGVGPEYFGLALFCKNTKWTGVCDDSFTCHTARLFCQKLGYAGAFNIRGEAYWGYFYSTLGNGGVDHYAWSCSSSHNSLSQCSYYYHSSCNAYHDQLGIICYPNDRRTQCTDGAVRLTNGTSTSNGRVEYCFEGAWSAFCWMSSSAAAAVCRTLGYNTSYAIVYRDERYGVSSTQSGFNTLNCPSGATSVTQCTAVRKSWSNGCYLSIGKCGIETGLQCYNGGITCTDGSVRLVNGTIQQEGRVEVCTNGIWGMVCQSNWNAIDAFIACRELGYTGTGPISYYNGAFGISTGPAVWTNLRCFGWENSLFRCSKTVYPSGSCDPIRTIGVVCKEGCSWGQVRLVGGAFENEGMVQVCYNQLWGLVSDRNFDGNDARVVCNQLGYTGGYALAQLGSQYGKPNMTFHLKDVACTGTELNINSCTKTRLSVANGKLELSMAEAAGVDCIYDVPTDPPCVPLPAAFNSQGTECPTNGAVRLMNGDQLVALGGNSAAGRLEYCYNGYWSSVCRISSFAASLACSDLGFSDYSWATIVETGEFGTVRNFSLIDNITCSGVESSLTNAGCAATINTTCTPYCSANLGLRCFKKVAPAACSPEGAIRLADGIIQNEGRVEVCVNGVWGTVCDEQWDKTDAHIVCKQLGFPDLEPYLFNNSEFGDGVYPIAYNNLSCVGYESRLYDCNKNIFPTFDCPRGKLAGALCGYDCNNGDIRLSGSQFSYEGTVQVCFDHLWGLISDASWTTTSAQVVCQQLGFQASGSISYQGSQYGKPNLTIHMTGVDCTGQEGTLDDCTFTTLSLQQGKDMLSQTGVAGVKCYTPDQCVTPPTDGADCTPGDLRLVGGQPNVPEGNLQYCYSGRWSPFCYLGPTEATVACRQLGYTNYDLTSVFADNRFGNFSNTSLFQNISCTANAAATRLSDCTVVDICQSTCQYPIGLRCYAMTNCNEGDVRLAGGDFASEGRVEVCSNGIWGAVCGAGFDAVDAHVVCKELQLGLSEPTVFTNSFFGDGDNTITFSNLGCKGYEASILECDKSSYGSFTCSRDNIAGVICQENCNDGDVRLSGGSSNLQGTVQVCFYGTWGIIADADWDNNDAQVVCKQLGYSQGGAAVTGSQYGKPNRTVQLSNVGCTGAETALINCVSTTFTFQDGRDIYPHVQAAGVMCSNEQPTSALSGAVNSNGALVGIAIVAVLLVLLVVVIIGLILYVVIERQRVLKANTVVNEPRVKMSGLGDGVDNPMAGLDLDDDEGGEFDTADQDELVERLEKA